MSTNQYEWSNGKQSVVSYNEQFPRYDNMYKLILYLQDQIDKINENLPNDNEKLDLKLREQRKKLYKQLETLMERLY